MKLTENHIKLHKAISARGIGRICNDLLPEELSLLTKKEWVEFCQNYHQWNGDPDEFDANRPVMMDFMVMDYLNFLLYQTAK